MNVDSVRGSIYTLDVNPHRRKSKLHSMMISNNNQNMLKSFCSSNKEIREQIQKALENVRKKAKEGDDVCERIL